MDSLAARDAVLTAYAQSLIRFKARQLSRKPGFSRSDEEDFAQELTLHLVAQAHQYDPKRASVNTFAARVIESKVRMMVRERRRQKRAAGFAAQSLEQTPRTADQVGASFWDNLADSDQRRRAGADDEVVDRSETVAAVVQAFASLPPELQDVCRLLIDGTSASTARNLGISRRQVRNAIARIREHFEAAGLGNS